MHAPSVKSPQSSELVVHPVAGPLFAAAAKIPPVPSDHADECAKLLCLVAAYLDAGAQPSVRELATRMKFTGKWQVQRVDKRLAELEQAGVLSVRRPSKPERRDGRRNRYELKVDGGPR